MRALSLLCLAALASCARACADKESAEVCESAVNGGFCHKPCTTYWAKTNCAKSCGFCTRVGKEPPCTGDDCPCVDYEADSVCSVAAKQGWCKSMCTEPDLHVQTLHSP